MPKFPDYIQDMAFVFAQMQDKRQRADYDPGARFTKSEIANDILLAEQTITNYRSVTAKHRRAFCIYLLLRLRDEAPPPKKIAKT